MIKHVESVNEFRKEVMNGTVLVDFFATWCGPCQMLSPLIEELDKKHDIKVLKINVDEASDLARQFRIASIPTLVVFKDGKMIRREMGYMPLSRLESLIS